MESSKSDHDTDQEVELPPAPVPLFAFRKPHIGRKRTWDKDNVLLNDSSDPAVFSSDDYQAGSLEDYASKKRKKHHWRGTWWGQRAKRLSLSSSSQAHIEPTHPHRAHRQFKRNYDSGIYMGSEGTESSIDEEFLEDVRKKAATVDHEKVNDDEIQEDPSTVAPVALPQHHVSVNQDFRAGVQASMYSKEAQAIIETCLEDGNETIDLSRLWLSSESVPPFLLSPLQSFAKVPPIHEPPASQDAYESLEPQLRLFLSNNNLTRVPSGIFNLHHLNVLSLRQNRLRDIPPAIGRLTNLAELNIGSNEIEVLPWEILHMMRVSGGNLKKFSPFPNPFKRFQDHQMEDSRPNKKRKRHAVGSRMLVWSASQITPMIRRVAKSSVTFYQKDGRQCRPLPSQMPQSELPQLTRERTPSLLELSLRASTQLPYFEDIVSEIETTDDTGVQDPESEPNHIPENLRHLLQMASNVVNAGGQTCPICGKAFMIHRAEWIEWWDLRPQANAQDERRATDGGATADQEEYDALHAGNDPSDRDSQNGEDTASSSLDKRRLFANVVPFRKRVCSWGCVDK